ncbi:hypothetical protein NDU88_010473 [Pleurodeles waltl]|uniref:SEA domain-containing protein n=1 Tax=Pleurodeles waltl TaxID=8319 RepID=A0AAV7QUH0_PLEWA|nr:hypothetical protein NDU88_010473 [Pleurodeles waltl]
METFNIGNSTSSLLSPPHQPTGSSIWPNIRTNTQVATQKACGPFLSGSTCQNGANVIDVIVASDAPTKDVYVLLKINQTFDMNLENPSSSQYNELKTKTEKIAQFYRKVFRGHYRKMTVNGFSSGSIIVNTSASYRYNNNQTEIDSLNNNLDSEVTDIFNSSETLNVLASMFNVTVVELLDTSSDSPITVISQLQGFMKCSLDFANYTMVCNNGTCTCLGSCYTDPDVCNQAGRCFNRLYGPVCE